MGYPLTFAYNGDHFARINHDGSFSIDWQKTTNVRYETPNNKNRAIIACSVILLAAKDNIFLKPWSESDAEAQTWTHKVKIYDIMNPEPKQGSMLGNFAIGGESFAKIDGNGNWSINWEKVDELAREPLTNWQRLAVVALCRLMKAAQYRFPTIPWNGGQDEDEDD